MSSDWHFSSGVSILQSGVVAKCLLRITESEEKQKVKNFPILGIMHRIKGFIFSIFYPIACEINYSNSKKTCPLALDIFFLVTFVVLLSVMFVMGIFRTHCFQNF